LLHELILQDYDYVYVTLTREIFVGGINDESSVPEKSDEF
jgi:hypothetical protein